MISLLLSLVLAGSSGLTPETPSGVPVSGVATWFGARCPEGVTNFGRKDTCTPFKTVAEGGRGATGFSWSFFGPVGDEAVVGLLADLVLQQR